MILWTAMGSKRWFSRFQKLEVGGRVDGRSCVRSSGACCDDVSETLNAQTKWSKFSSHEFNGDCCTLLYKSTFHLTVFQYHWNANAILNLYSFSLLLMRLSSGAVSCAPLSTSVPTQLAPAETWRSTVHLCKRLIKLK